MSRVLVAHGHSLVRREVRDALRPSGWEVLGTPYGGEARSAAAEFAPDAFLCGGPLADGDDAMRLIEELGEAHALPGVVILRDGVTPTVLREVCSPYVFGCVTWPLASLQLCATVTTASAHREGLRRARELRALQRRLVNVQTELSRALDDRSRQPLGRRVSAALSQRFSPREREVLDLLLDHKRPKTIATELGISPSTVRNHLKSMYSKVGVGSQEALLDAVRER